MGLLQKQKKHCLSMFIGVFLAVLLCIVIGDAQSTFAAKKGVEKKEYYVVSRIEGQVVILEDENGEQIIMERKKLPKRIKEEDVLSYKNGKYRRDLKKTKERKKAIETELNNFFSS